MRRDLIIIPLPTFIIFLKQKNDKSPNSSRRRPNNQCKHLPNYFIALSSIDKYCFFSLIQFNQERKFWIVNYEYKPK